VGEAAQTILAKSKIQATQKIMSVFKIGCTKAIFGRVSSSLGILGACRKKIFYKKYHKIWEFFLKSTNPNLRQKKAPSKNLEGAFF